MCSIQQHDAKRKAHDSASYTNLVIGQSKRLSLILANNLDFYIDGEGIWSSLAVRIVEVLILSMKSVALIGTSLNWWHGL